MYISVNKKPREHHEIVREMRVMRSQIEELKPDILKVSKVAAFQITNARLMLGYALKEFHANDPYVPDRHAREASKKVYKAPVDQPREKPIKFSHKEGTVEHIDEIVKHIEAMIGTLQSFYMDVGSTKYNYNWVYRSLESAYTYLRIAQGHLGIKQFELAKQHGYEIRSGTSDTLNSKVPERNGRGFRAKGAV